MLMQRPSGSFERIGLFGYISRNNYLQTTFPYPNMKMLIFVITFLRETFKFQLQIAGN